ncbi:Tc toxin subunit A [Pseudomonas sp. W5-01]|uniref:Tc toxin subunit A-related protein n=1 Tax=Pseudomonas sp. W5-01 TaxID=3097454 RepID=UPI0039795884
MDDYTTTSAVYGKMFPEQVADRCSSDALEANNGPFSYLHTLYQQALSLEAKGDAATQITLGERRPDIGERVLDEASLETQVPLLTLVIEAMTRQAKIYVGDKKNLAEQIAAAQYPVQLPFHHPLEQIKAVLGVKRCSLFNLLQQTDYGYPNFAYGNLRTAQLRNIMRKATGFSPTLQALLLDESASNGADFLLQRYGVKGAAQEALEQLSSVEFLARQTGLKPEDVLDLLATSGVADDGQEAFTTVKQSNSYSPGGKINIPIAGHIFGATFINNATAPALSLQDTLSGAGIALRVKGANADHFGRIHKIIHLQHALKIPFAEVDLLVMAALRSEGQKKDFHLTENTLRALGVFLHLRDEYQITAEQFAALINEVTPYAVGETEPFLDRVLDGPGAGRLADIDAPLVLNETEFELPVEVSVERGAPNAVIAELCRAFSVEENIANAYLSQITRTLRLKKPALTLGFFSSLYRLTRLPRLLRLDMNEGASLIALLNTANPHVMAQLAGKPIIATNDDQLDILDVLVGLANLETWLREKRISAASLLTWLTPHPADIPASLKAFYGLDARIERSALDAIPKIKSSLVNESQLSHAAGPGVTVASGSWLEMFSTYIDRRGLITPFVLDASETLVSKLTELLDGKITSTTGLLIPKADQLDIAANLESLIQNAVIAQDDVVKHILGTAFGKSNEGLTLKPEHALPLLSWVNVSRHDLLAGILEAEPSTAEGSAAPKKGLDVTVWSNLAHHAQVIKHLKLSPAGLTALLDKPQWFALESATLNSKKGSKPLPVLNLDLCYQLGHYHDWVLKCEENGFEEKDALSFFTDIPKPDDPKAVLASARQLGKLMGWLQGETFSFMSSLKDVKQNFAQEQSIKPVVTFDDFIKLLTPAEKKLYDRWEIREKGSLGTLLLMYMLENRTSDVGSEGDTQRGIYDKFKQFMVDNPAPLKVFASQYLPDVKPNMWEELVKYQTNPTRLTLKLHYPETLASEEAKATPESADYSTSSISDIDYALRTQRLCKLTNLSCRSVLALYWLDSTSTFDDYRSSANQLLGVCAEDELIPVQSRLQETWRDALAGYLIGHWAKSNAAAKTNIHSMDDLSSYFLTDILVSSVVRSSIAIQHTASLQHYLHKLYARLEPGYLNSTIPEDLSTAWRQFASEYGLWKIWRTQINHPENLIYYANRPNKTAAFQSLEVELNQGKLDPALLQTAITSYLTKFEQTSNLQIVSGYLDGVDPKNDTYHFIGKTNASPPEYYWRSVDMALRDDKERLSPLAWTEWEKIAVTPTGQITQNRYTVDNEKYACDTIRPVMIEGRPYVFWVERGTVGLPSSDEKNQTPTKFKKLSVQYIYKQSDGFWSTPNEWMSLDGAKDGKRLDDLIDDESSTAKIKPKIPNPYLKDDTYQPGLIALVNIEGERARDPWLTVMLYNCAPDSKSDAPYGVAGRDYFTQSRDLLLINTKILDDSSAGKLSKTIYNSYNDITKIQHPYNGDEITVTFKEAIHDTLAYDLDKYDESVVSSPHRLNTYDKESMTDDVKKILSKVDQPANKKPPSDVPPLLVKIPFWYYAATDQINAPWYKKAAETFNSSYGSKVKFVAYTDDSYTSTAAKNSYAYSNLNAVASIEATLIADKLKTLNLKNRYLRVIANRSGLIIKSVKIRVRVITKQEEIEVNMWGDNITADKGGACTLNSSGAVPFYKLGLSMGYSVNIDGQNHEFMFVDTIFTINKPSLLLEESFRITVYEDTQHSKKFLDSFPIRDIQFDPDSIMNIRLRLYAKAPNATSFTKLSEENVIADGKSSISHDYSWTEEGDYVFALCEAGNPGNNVFVTYKVSAISKDETWDISIKRNEQQAQYLNLNKVANHPPIFPTNVIRLNTLFGKQLVSRASRSVERALEWDAQLLKEPTIDPDIRNPSVDFHGANGIYFRELFLHLPNLVATRLSEQQQFDEAERWFTEYLFDPFRTIVDEKQRPPFWNTRPLAEVGSGTSELQKVVTPTTRAFILSRYNRQAVFLSMVENWQRQGDHFYRQLTPSTLNHAWLSYQKALKLVGPLPERTAVSRWEPTALSTLKGSAFRTPINERVIEARKVIEHRLFNLRHGLTIDGKLLPVMDWRAEGADPSGFGQRGIGHLISTYNSDRMQVPAYRFRQLIPMARAAVQQLQDMGRHYMKLMEDEFNTTLSVLLKQQEIRISDFTLKLKQESISSVKAKKNTLLLSKQAAVFRRDHYGKLIDVGRSPMEEAATALQWTAAALQNCSIPPKILASLIKAAVPTIYGMAVGGNEPSKTIDTVSDAAQIAGKATLYVADKLLVESGYERRATGWQFERKQAELEIQSIDLQLKETNIELNAATISLDEARANRINLEEAYVAMTTGFTIIPIYNWLVARQELLYAPAYDAVLSLCLSAEAAWRYEIGDYKRPAFVKTTAWIDSYKGMLAGESLLVDLQEMENAYLQSNERRLTIKKTINIWEAKGPDEINKLKAVHNTPLTCQIKSAAFDSNYPGHYLRQIKHVSVSFVMASDASEAMKEVSAILTQIDSTTLIDPTEEGASYLYEKVLKPPISVKRNLRAQQQIALSSGVADDGLGFGPGDWVYELMFHDGRYLPFEGTGAISRWQLSFPDEQFVKSLVNGDKALVKSIQLHMVYTAVDGGKDFTDKVKALRDKP